MTKREKKVEKNIEEQLIEREKLTKYGNTSEIQKQLLNYSLQCRK